MVNGYFYRLPDKIITISETARRMLLTRGIRSDVVVVPNGVEVRAGRRQERDGFRHNHGLRSEDFVIATIGRIDFRQKGQDFAVQTISRYRQELVGCKFLFIGSGPDERRLQEMVADSQLQAMVRILPWTDKAPEIYSSIDMLLVPSRFEGVPLVMLEAMSRKLPIVASKVDGMAEFLPGSWLFPFGDCQALAKTVAQVKNSDNASLLELHQKRIQVEFTTANFCAKFSRAVLAQELQHSSNLD
jgi:glycosyltransferase involved in cell wall biosynthesis